MQEPTIHQVKITGGFWAEKLRMNAESAIFYQWKQLEDTRCIDNFRIAAGLKEGFREGFFFADSDAYKWLDAASRILAGDNDPRLAALVNEFIEILENAQDTDGYLFTYNQLHFPGQRWVNLQIEHEFYCLGHLIEAGVSHFESTVHTRLLEIAQKAADLLVRNFTVSTPDFTDGHEEIEIALIRLWRVTHKTEYLALAKAFLERRGRIKGYPFKFTNQALRAAKRMKKVSQAREEHKKSHPDSMPFALPARNKHEVPLLTWPRFVINLLNGKYNQQHRPLELQTQAVGHSVRFAYLQTARAMLSRETGHESTIKPISKVWEHMVSKRMYVTGGIGSLPLSEGFGRDYELDPESAYAETCAALGSMLWDHEMAQLTGEPRFEDLFEWQLYNAASVGIGKEGHSYFYNNPLTCRGGVTRAPWYDIPCCPSNLSRVWASLDKYVYSYEEEEIRVNQYITSETRVIPGQQAILKMESDLPWWNRVMIKFEMSEPLTTSLVMRLPAWADSCEVMLNNDLIHPEISLPMPNLPTANGLNFNAARWMKFHNIFNHGDTITLKFAMPIRLIRHDRRVPKCGGKAAITRGPIVYCLESIDNSIDIFNVNVDPQSLEVVFEEKVLEGTWMIKGKTRRGEPLTFIPYMLWGNRGESRMTVFVD